MKWRVLTEAEVKERKRNDAIDLVIRGGLGSRQCELIARMARTRDTIGRWGHTWASRQVLARLARHGVVEQFGRKEQAAAMCQWRLTEFGKLVAEALQEQADGLSR